MTWVSRAFAPLVLFAGVACAIAFASTEDAGAQPPFGKGQFGKGFPGKGGDKKKDDKKGEEKKAEGKKGEEKRSEGKKGPAPKSDATVDAWVKVLIEKITDPHDTVRDSARGALVSVGPPAIPALQVLVDGSDPAKAVAARKVIGAIHGGHGHGQPGGPWRPAFAGPGGMAGPPGKGPMGPGRGFGGRGGPGGDRGPGRGREASETEIAPMPRVAVRD